MNRGYELMEYYVQLHIYSLFHHWPKSLVMIDEKNYYSFLHYANDHQTQLANMVGYFH